MSWIDQIKNDLIIYTGAGDIFKPSWINAKLLQEYNFAEFNFPEVDGSLVIRKKRKGIKFSLEIYFQGEDYLQTSESFRVASLDPNFWVLEHPMYGVIPCQPTSLEFDNSQYNVSKITGSLIETIVDDQPLVYGPEFNLPSKIEADKEELDSIIGDKFIYDILPGDVNVLRNTNNKAYKFSVPIITIPDEFEVYNNLFNNANSLINTAIASPLLAIRATNAALTQPAKFTENVKTRVNVLASTFDALRTNVESYVKISSKEIYQSQGGTLLTSMCLAAATPLANNYTNSNSVIQIIDLIFAKYSLFLTDLDNLQSPNGGSPDSFIPDVDVLNLINNIVNETLSGLFTIALSSRKERSIITETDTNIIVLTHRLYGLDPNDQNINELIANNGFGLNHMLQIQKGTKVTYYI